MNLKSLILESIEDAERQKIIDSIITYDGIFGPRSKWFKIEDFIKDQYPDLTLNPEELKDIKVKRLAYTHKIKGIRQRQDPKFRARKAAREREKKAAMTPEEREAFNKRNRELRSIRMQDPENRKRDNDQKMEWEKKALQDPNYKANKRVYRAKWMREWRKNPKNKEKIKISNHKHRQNPENKIKIRARNNQLHKEKMKTNPEYALKIRCRTRFYQFVRSKGKISFGKYVQIDYEKLKDHLERLFKDGMSWENRSKWHIDHIRPLSSFKYINPDGSINVEEIKASWAIENLQPLWDKENISKGAKWDPQGEEHFQIQSKDFPEDS
jgi:hypothetical protein